MARPDGHAFALLLAGLGVGAAAAGGIPAAAFTGVHRGLAAADADAGLRQLYDGSGANQPEPEPDANECKLLANATGYLVQGVLFAIGFLTLLIKRWRESPQRELNVWALDVVKQGCSAFCAHFIGMANAWVTNNETDKGDECSWYFIAFFLDTTIGVLLAYAGIKAVERLATNQGWPALMETGKYGSPTDYSIWAKQMVWWCFITVLARALVLGIMLLLLDPLGSVSHVVADIPSPNDPELRLWFVMILCPLGMNIVQLWVQDTFLRWKDGWATMKVGAGSSRRTGEGLYPEIGVGKGSFTVGR